uniref:NB-ARC domain-containing protein n=1 Tax=Fagus sylvatica TaxID=28930 RepID=A0A2N9H397_FAGSY
MTCGKHFPLEKVGIPEPTSSNGCKLVLTTRLLNVCLGMSYLKAIAEDVLERCAQLPLAIVTIAASFKCLIHDFQWRDALEDLKTSVKECLLHCALYPEDFKIDKQELIEHLIDEKIIERKNSRQAEFDRGYSMLIELENACLLEGGIEEYSSKKFVKMHDLVRDMVLQVASPQFKVEGHLGLEDFSDEGKWREDLVKASLMYNNISRIASKVSPMCPRLSTLLLQGNRSLKDVPDSLFEHLHGLNVLNLSYTDIESLPNSVSNLENLTTLRLGGCWKLKHVPSLAKLTKLRKLDLGRTEITEVPHGLDMLVNLRYLDLNWNELKIMPSEILPKLSCLQYLAVNSKFSKPITVKGEEVASLKNLETFRGLFSDMYEFSTYIRSLKKGRLATYEIYVGEQFSIIEIDLDCLQDLIWGKKVGLANCNISRGEESFVLPKDVHDLQIYSCNNLRCLCDVPSLNHATELKCILLWLCKGIEHVLCSSSSSCTLTLQTLEILQLYHLDNLRVLFRKEKDASAQVPPHTFSRLKRIYIYQCSKLKKLLPPGLLQHLPNLEEIKVGSCKQLEEIIEEEEEEGMDTTKITLPRLKKLWLFSLPELKSICSSSKVISCDSLEEIWIKECPKLKRLPLSLPLLNGQLSPPPSLKNITADDESLEWDCQDTKNVLQPFFRKIGEKPIMLFLDVPSRLIKSSLIGDQVEDGMKYFRGLCEQGELHS